MVAHPPNTAHAVRVAYGSLYDHLSGGTEALQLSFADIEALVGSLPPSARKFRQWWENSRSHSQARAWLDAGYRVAQVDLVGEVVWFAPDSGPHGSAVTADNPVFGAPVTLLPARVTSRSGLSGR